MVDIHNLSTVTFFKVRRKVLKCRYCDYKTKGWINLQLHFDIKHKKFLKKT